MRQRRMSISERLLGVLVLAAIVAIDTPAHYAR